MTRVCLAVALLLVAGACGGGDSDDGAATKASTTTSSTTGTGEDTGRDAVEAGGSPSGTDTAAGQGQAGSTPATQGEAPPAPTAPNAAQPVRPGTYEYDTDGQTTSTGALGGTQPLPTLTTLKADPPDGGRQQSIRDMRDEDGNGSATTTVFQYKNDGVYLESLTTQTRVSGATFTYEFRPQPPQLVAPAGAGVGFHTEFTMTSTNGGLRTTTVIDALSEETVTIGGTAVRTVKVRLQTEIEGDADGESTSDLNVDPERYLVVREHVVSDIRSALGNSHTEHTSTLRSLEPK